jgi:hypothetical protein
VNTPIQVSANIRKAKFKYEVSRPSTIKAVKKGVRRTIGIRMGMGMDPAHGDGNDP